MRIKQFNLTRLTALLGGVLSCIVLSSCANFLDGEDIKNEILNEIKYNNTKSITVKITCNEDVGTVFPEFSYTEKLGYDHEIQFIPNTQNYAIKDPATIFKAVSRLNESESRANCISFTAIEQTAEDKVRGMYRVKARVVKDADDILIMPDCQEFPRIVNIYPAFNLSGLNANTPIIADFNLPMNDMSFGSDLITIRFGALDMSEYFENPVLNSERTTVTITPKLEELISFMKQQSFSYIDLTVSFGKGLTTSVDNLFIPLVQSDKNSITVRYKPEIEKTPPLKHTFFMTRKEISVGTASSVTLYEQFTQENFITGIMDDTKVHEQQILKNRNNGTVYIYGRYYDSESGVRTVTVTEQRTHTWQYSEAVSNEEIYSKSYTASSENAEFLDEGNGYTSFCIKHTFKSLEGAIKVNVTVSDACDNTSIEEQVTSITRTELAEVYLQPFNVPRGLKYETYSNGSFTYLPIDLSVYNGNHITIYDAVPEDDCSYYYDDTPYDLYEVVFGYAGVTAEDFTVYAQYKDRNGVERTDKFSNYDSATKSRSLDLQVDSLNDLDVKFIIFDDIGIRGEVTGHFPPTLAVASVENNSTYKTVTLCGANGNSYTVLNLIENDSEGNTTSIKAIKVTNGVSNKIKLYNDKSYSVIASMGGSGSEYMLVGDTQPFVLNNEEPPLPQISSHTITCNNDNPDYHFLNVSFDISNQDEFDTISVSYKGVRVGNSGNTLSGSSRLLKNNGVYNPSITISTDTIYKYDLTFYFYGIKSLRKSGAKDYGVSHTTAIEFDNYPPEINFERTDFNNYTATLSDDESGPDTGVLYIGDRCYLLNETTEYKAVIPISLLNDNFAEYIVDGYEQEVCKITYKAFDKAGNVKEISDYIGSYYYKIPELSDLQKTNTGKWSFKFRNVYTFDFKTTPNDSGSNAWIINTDTLQTDGSWINASITNNKSICTLPNPVEEDKVSYRVTMAFYDVILPSDSFVRLIPTYKAGSIYYGTQYYLYTGEPGTGNYDHLWKYDSTGTSVLVSSDAPVYVHVLSSLKPYNQCKDWNYRDWEKNRTTVCDSYMDFSASDHSARIYNIPVNQIESGSCYVVIAHFADNHVEMSEVMQR